MLKNNKASVISVTVVDYDSDLETYIIKYELRVKSGIIRRRTVLYNSTSDLTNDERNKPLIERIKQEILMFDKGVKSKRLR